MKILLSIVMVKDTVTYHYPTDFSAYEIPFDPPQLGAFIWGFLALYILIGFIKTVRSNEKY